MKLYTIYDQYHMYHILYNTCHGHSDFLKEAMRCQTPYMVDFGTSMINKRKRKKRK